MKKIDVMIARIYITESSESYEKIIRYLKNDINIRGISIFRAISGFGESGEHSSKFIDISLDLPLVIEFFDSKEKITQAVDYIGSMIKSEHLVYWEAMSNG